MAISGMYVTFSRILPIGFDDYRVKVDVRAAYETSGDLIRRMELTTAIHHDMLCHALKVAKLERYISQVAQELADGRLSATEAATAVSDYASKL